MDIREKIFLAYPVETKAIDEQNRRIRFVISTDQPDRDGDIVETDAIVKSIPAFAKNPVCLACHQHRLPDGMPPVVGSWDTDSFKATEHRSEMDLVFATTELGETWWNLYKNKHVRAVSIGFRLLDGFEEVKDKIRVYHITKIELYEISCVPVPANPAALSKLKELHILEQEKSESDSILKQIENRQSAIEAKMNDILERLDDIAALQISDPDSLGKALSGAPKQPAESEEKNSGDVLKHIATLFKEITE